jgi:hypothetical protein
MVILPLALAMLTGLALFALALKNKTVVSAECRAAVWQAQKEMAGQLTLLLKLNPKARHLRWQRRAAEAELKTAVATFQPELIAAARAQISLVTLQQLNLRAEQQRLLAAAGAERLRSGRTLSAKLHLQGASVGRVQSQVATLAVRPVPPRDLTPDFIPEDGFAEKQKLRIHLKGRLLYGAPDWLLAGGKLPSLQFDGRCAATLQEEEAKWRAKITAAK